MQTHSQRCCVELPWKSLWVYDECLVIKLILGTLIIISGRRGTSCKYLHKHLTPGAHARVRVCMGGKGKQPGKCFESKNK